MSLTNEANAILPMASRFSRELKGLTGLETALSQFGGVRQKNDFRGHIKHRIRDFCLSDKCRRHTSIEIKSVAAEESLAAPDILESFLSVRIADRQGFYYKPSPEHHDVQIFLLTQIYSDSDRRGDNT